MNKRILNPEQKEKIFEELLEYFKRSNKNQFGYEQDKLISYEEAQIILDKLNKQKEVLDKIKELEKDFIKLRQITLTKYNSNEWNNCLSYNDDILPIKNKLDKLLEEIE